MTRPGDGVVGTLEERIAARDRISLRILTNAKVAIQHTGRSAKCANGQHAGAPGGCANDGTTCLSECHDPKGAV